MTVDERRSIAQDLVESARKEAVGQVAKSVVRAVKAVLVAALAAICVLAWSLWTANPVATVALAVVSLSFGMAVGAAVGWRRACKAKDEEIAAVREECERAVAEARSLRSLDELRVRFRSMSFGAKKLCAGIWQNGGIEREPGPAMPKEDAVSEARAAGFVQTETTSDFGRVRFLATDDLTRLFTEGPEEYERVLRDFSRGRYELHDGRLVRVG